MSAFIVSASTINRIVTAVAATPYLAGDLPFDVTSPAGKHQFACAMLALNEDAVRQRYGSGDAGAYAFRPEPATPMQVYKSLRCWLYQCDEGDVPESSLYKAMRDLSSRMANALIQRTREYDMAEWG